MDRHLLKYALYQEAVQSVEHDADLYANLYRQVHARPARRLREDFCGTFALSRAWVKRHPENEAIGLDLDPEPLVYGLTQAERELSLSQKRRLRPLKKNVISRTEPCDLAVAGNFSFWVFKTEAELVRYFRAVRASLDPKRGLFILDLAGGTSMNELGPEKRTIRSRTLGKYTYIWDAKSFNPITHEARYAIHFELSQGPRRERRIRDAFEYDWRLWSIPEVRAALRAAGFGRTFVFWDVAPSRREEKYRITDQAENHESWIAYVAGAPN
jgi:hypothetical protein